MFFPVCHLFTSLILFNIKCLTYISMFYVVMSLFSFVIPFMVFMFKKLLPHPKADKYYHSFFFLYVNCTFNSVFNSTFHSNCFTFLYCFVGMG